MREIPEQFYTLIEQVEGCKLQPYKDSAGIPTIYYGHVIKPTEIYLHTDEDALQYLKKDATTAAVVVDAALGNTINDNQYAALISFVFNIGTGAFAKSTMLKLLGSGQFELAGEQFFVWDKIHINGEVVVSKGLHNRREAEFNLFHKAV